ncbi:MAG: M14 family zinc carboxypeptidase, partial [Bacteroidales bacterium]
MIKQLLIAMLFITTALQAQTKENNKFKTYFEAHEYNQTPRYPQTIEYCKLLADNSPWITYTSIGKSPQGRDIPLLIVDKDGDTSVTQCRAKGKAIVLIEACIHAGEPDGKEAGFMLIRDIAIYKKNTHLLDNVTLLFIPIINVDGHEQFSAYNRINQNGPLELGTRTTAQRINMNR